MKRLISLIIGLLICVSFLPQVFGTSAGWQVLKTEYFEIFYKGGYETNAKEVLEVLTVYRDNVKKLSGVEIPKLRVVIEDIGTLSNASADPLNPNIHLFVYPPGTTAGGMPGIGYGENWWRMAGLHESIHIAQVTQTRGFPKILTTLFGNVFSPNLIVPNWIAEGVTVSGESQLSLYEGRVRDGFFDAVLLSQLQSNKFPSLLEMTYTPFDFPTIAGGCYLYGGLFLNYLREKYGQDKLNEFFHHQGGLFLGWFLGWLFPSLGIDDAARMTYGKPFEQLLTEWKEHCLAQSKTFAIDGNAITSDKLTVYSDLLSDSDYIYYIKRESRKTGAYCLYEFEKILRRNIFSQQEQELISTTSSFSTRPQISDNKLYYSVYDLKRGFANSTLLNFGYISNLHCRDLVTGKDSILFRDGFRSFTVMQGGEILYSKDRQDKFGSEIYLFSSITQQKQLLAELDYLIDQIVSNDKHFVVSARPNWQNWGIYLFDRNTLTLKEIINTAYAETNPSIANNKLLFVANYEKTYRIYAYDLVDGKFYQLTTGSFAHFPTVHNDELYFVGLNSAGTNLYHKPIIFSEITQPYYQSPEIHDLKISLAPTQGSYFDVLKTATPSIRLPILGKNPGAFLSGYDVTNEHSYETIVRFGQSPSYSLLYENASLKPLRLGVETERKNGEQDNKVYANYPLYLSNEPGLSYLFPLLELILDEEGTKTYKKLAPGIGAGFRYPKWRIQNRLNYVIENKMWDSIENTAVFSYYLNPPKIFGGTLEPEWGSELKTILYLFNNQEKTDLRDLEIRGYWLGDAIRTRCGGTFALEYSLPVFKSRCGSWNPNIFLEDVSLVGFSDIGFGEGVKSIYSAGAELRIEAALGFSVKFIPTFGLVFDKEGKMTPYIMFYLTQNSFGGRGKTNSTVISK
jgi:hypothetical protein